jgi:hypothetical protein
MNYMALDAIWWQFNCKKIGKKWEYKSIYMLSYVPLNIVIKALEDLCKSPLLKCKTFN